MATTCNKTICSWWILILVATFATSKYGCVDGIQTLNENDFEPKPKGTLKTIEVSKDGYLIDCVDIYKQPSLDNPIFKEDLQMEPSLPYQNVFNKTNNLLFNKKGINRSPKQLQDWHKYGECPQGTIPIRRNWNNNGTIFRNAHPSQQIHEYAVADQENGTYHGAGASFNLWNPHVTGDNELSLAQVWIVSGENLNLNTIEAGWIVYPNKFRDTRSLFFICWTADGYQHFCYNNECRGTGFRQTYEGFCLGCPLEPVSEYGGQAHGIRVVVNRDFITGHWWLYFNNLKIGYFPRQIFTTLGNGADRSVTFGGEITNNKDGGRHTATQMGSGHFSAEGATRASYIRNINVVNQRGETEHATLDYRTTHPECYDILPGRSGTSYGTFFFYGGPGYSQRCP